MSTKFGRVIGQETIKRFLLTSIRRGKVSHAYVIEGETGMGKKLIAKTFAEYLVCENDRACGVCESCLLSRASTHPDIITLIPEKSKIGVDDIRKVIKEISIKPYMAKKKVVIIPESDGITVEAQNALLKVLEEPPSYVVFMILIQNADVLLDTILSRVMKLTLSPYTEEEVIEALKESGQNGALVTETNIGKALALGKDETYISIRAEILDQIENLITSQQSAIFKMTSFFEKNKSETQRILEIMLGYFRDIIFINIGRQELVRNKDSQARLTVLSERIGLKAAYRIAQSTIKAQNMHSRNVNYSVMTTTYANRCWEVLNGRDSRDSF